MVLYDVSGWQPEMSLDGAIQCLKVTNVMPGVTNTGIWAAGAGAIGLDAKETEEIGATILQPEDVATLVWETVCKPERSGHGGWGQLFTGDVQVLRQRRLHAGHQHASVVSLLGDAKISYFTFYIEKLNLPQSNFFSTVIFNFVHVSFFWAFFAIS